MAKRKITTTTVTTKTTRVVTPIKDVFAELRERCMSKTSANGTTSVFFVTASGEKVPSNDTIWADEIAGIAVESVVENETVEDDDA